MSYVIAGVRLLALCFCLYGYIRWLCGKIRPEFTPAVLFAGIGAAMFFAGILNIMRLAAAGILAGGAVLAVRGMFGKRRSRNGFKKLLCPALIFYAGVLALLAVLIYGAKFTEYDDFSHWATVLKVMLRNNRFPNFEESDIIYFPSYPPGTAAFIWFFEKAAGISSEWSQMFFQAALTVAMTLPLFAYAKSALGSVVSGAVSLMLTATLLPGGGARERSIHSRSTRYSRWRGLRRFS